VPKPVLDEEFDSIVQSGDAFTVAIRGHQAVDELLSLAISETLANPHQLEIRNLAFSLKVDLAVAMGIVADRGAFMAFNRIRNRFAHDRNASFGEKDADDLYNTWSDYLRKLASRSRSDYTEPFEVLQDTASLLFVLLQIRITQSRDARAELRIAEQLLHEVLHSKRKPAAPGETASQQAARLLADERKARRSRDEL
jgi:hypothetical protein